MSKPEYIYANYGDQIPNDIGLVCLDLSNKLHKDKNEEKRLINVCKDIVKQRKSFTVYMSGYDTDPRELSEIPEAKESFLVAVKKCGILGLCYKLTNENNKDLMDLNISTLLNVCLTQVVKKVGSGNVEVSLPMKEANKLIDESKQVAEDLYFS